MQCGTKCTCAAASKLPQRRVTTANAAVKTSNPERSITASDATTKILWVGVMKINGMPMMNNLLVVVVVMLSVN